MNYSNMTTEKLESLLTALEVKLDCYVGMSFMSPRSDSVSYEIDSVDSDEVLINANHFFNGLIRDYTVTIDGGVYDDVEYNRYNADEEIVDGGYMSFDRLPKIIRNAVLEIYALYREIGKINNILDARAEKESKEESKREDKEAHFMKRFEIYNAYIFNRDFRYVANALEFEGFDYDHFDNDFKEKLENDDDLGDLLEQFEDIESTQFLMYSQYTTDFYQKHEYDILAYLKTYGYDDNDNLQSIEDIMCSRVTAYVTGVLSEYGY